MDLVAEQLGEGLRSQGRFEVATVAPAIPRIARVALRTRPQLAFNADRLAFRFGWYPARLLASRRTSDLFHIADHTYAQLARALPAERTGIYLHDLDAFRSLRVKDPEVRPGWFRVLSSVTLSGLRRAALVFHSTRVLGEELHREGWVHPERLRLAPYGVSPAFTDHPRPAPELDQVLAPLGSSRFVLHVGTSVQRKRLDVLFRTFASLRPSHPDLWLVQQGAALTPDQRSLIDALGIGGRLLQPPKLSTQTLAALYQRATLVLVTSEREGFGLPVIEALACGRPVVASDLPTLREAGGGAALYCPMGEVGTFANTCLALLSGSLHAPPREQRIAQAKRFSWSEHARLIEDAYWELFERHGPARRRATGPARAEG